ncbi:MAG: ankyrin repeat domain-containing protein [Candidatus Anstonellales archaeon]
MKKLKEGIQEEKPKKEGRFSSPLAENCFSDEERLFNALSKKCSEELRYAFRALNRERRENLSEREREDVDKKLIEEVTNSSEKGVFNALLQGADPNAVEKEVSGYPVIILAIFRDSEALVRLLINAGADLQKKIELPKHVIASVDQGRDALIKAAAHKKEKIVKMLLEEGANPNSTDDVGLTALYEAAVNESMECIKYLESHYANPFIETEGKLLSDIIEEKKFSKEIVKEIRNYEKMFIKSARKVRLFPALASRKEKEFALLYSLMVCDKKTAKKAIEYL